MAEISEAVRAIDERNKSKAQREGILECKKEEKMTKAEFGNKPDQTLPLWRTDASAVAPGAPSSAEVNKDSPGLDQALPAPQNTDVR